MIIFILIMVFVPIVDSRRKVTDILATDRDLLIKNIQAVRGESKSVYFYYRSFWRKKVFWPKKTFWRKTAFWRKTVFDVNNCPFSKIAFWRKKMLA